MIISQNSKNINLDRDKLEDITEKFKEFKKHNFNVSRSITHVMDCMRGDKRTPDKKIKGKYLSEYFSQNKQVRIKKCNSWGEFAKFTDGNKEIKQTKSNACGTHLLCPFCASRKASKIQKRMEDFFLCFDDEIIEHNFDDFADVVNNEYKPSASEHTKEIYKKVNDKFGNILDLNWYFSVLTVKNSFDVDECLNHLKRSFQTIREKIKLYKKGRDIDTVFSVLGAVYSIEITYNPFTGFHPHINILMATDKKIDDCKMYKNRKQKEPKKVTDCYWNSKKLSAEWKSITKDSFITSCTPLNIRVGLKENLMEIIKYALKFNDMNTNILVEMYPHLYRQRFFGTLGFFYGLGLDKIEIEEFVSEREYIEFVMTYTKGQYHFSEKTKEIDYEFVDCNGNMTDLVTKDEALKQKKDADWQKIKSKK